MHSNLELSQGYKPRPHTNAASHILRVGYRPQADIRWQWMRALVMLQGCGNLGRGVKTENAETENSPRSSGNLPALSVRKALTQPKEVADLGWYGFSAKGRFGAFESWFRPTVVTINHHFERHGVSVGAALLGQTRSSMLASMKQPLRRTTIIITEN